MSRHGFRLDVPADARAQLAAGWLALGLAALVGSGVFAILLVVSRAPLVKDLFRAADFFRVALVVHVDLSVLVWFIAMAGVVWTLNSTTRAMAAGWVALGVATAGAVVMSIAPFVENAVPVTSNYVPVLDGRWFLGGLLAFGAGAAILVLRSMRAVPPVGVRLDGAAALRFGMNAALVSAAIALLAFTWSWWRVPQGIDGRAHYEVLFWGGGHVLQFTWTLLMLVAWLVLAEAIGIEVPLSPRIATLFFGVGLAAVFATPVIYLAWDVVSIEHYRYHTWLMRFGGGLAILPFTLAIGAGLAKHLRAGGSRGPLFASLVGSMILFGAGGLIGFAIEGANVRIPAHYHGCIVAVTLAMMGLVYHLLPRMGFAAPSARAASAQAWLYAAGQLAHVAGLAWSGGYGVQRKAPGAEQALRTGGELASMGLMGLGGLVAVIGGVMFLWLAIGSMAGRWKSSPSRS